MKIFWIYIDLNFPWQIGEQQSENDIGGFRRCRLAFQDAQLRVYNQNSFSLDFLKSFLIFLNKD